MGVGGVGVRGQRVSDKAAGGKEKEDKLEEEGGSSILRSSSSDLIIDKTIRSSSFDIRFGTL